MARWRISKRHIATAQKLGWTSECEPDEELARKVVARLQPAPGSFTNGKPKQRAAPVGAIELIRSWLHPRNGKRGLRLTRVRALLKQRRSRIRRIGRIS